MTRINCVPPEELTDAHLLAEYRELPRISALARPAPDAPPVYVLGRGHLLFFYSRGGYLKRRFEQQIVPEMQRRGFATNFTTYRYHPEGLNQDWTPTPEALALNRARIAERLSDKR